MPSAPDFADDVEDRDIGIIPHMVFQLEILARLLYSRHG